MAIYHIIHNPSSICDVTRSFRHLSFGENTTEMTIVVKDRDVIVYRSRDERIPRRMVPLHTAPDSINNSSKESRDATS